MAGTVGANVQLVDPPAQPRNSVGCSRNLLLCSSTMHLAWDSEYDVYTLTCNLLLIQDPNGSSK